MYASLRFAGSLARSAPRLLATLSRSVISEEQKCKRQRKDKKQKRPVGALREQEETLGGYCSASNHKEKGLASDPNDPDGLLDFWSVAIDIFIEALPLQPSSTLELSFVIARRTKLSFTAGPADHPFLLFSR